MYIWFHGMLMFVEQTCGCKNILFKFFLPSNKTKSILKITDTFSVIRLWIFNAIIPQKNKNKKLKKLHSCGISILNIYWFLTIFAKVIRSHNGRSEEPLVTHKEPQIADPRSKWWYKDEVSYVDNYLQLILLCIRVKKQV